MTIMSNSEMVHRLKGSGVDSFICQPGMSSTPVYKKTDKSHIMANVLDAAQKVMGQTEERGALPLLYAATAPEMAGTVGASSFKLLRNRDLDRVVLCRLTHSWAEAAYLLLQGKVGRT